MEQILSVAGDRAASFWGTHRGAELDLLLSHGGRRLGFEFKFSERPSTTKSMRIAQQVWPSTISMSCTRGSTSFLWMKR